MPLDARLPRGQWQNKPAIATTQVNNIHARRYSNISKNLGRIGP